MTDEVNVIPTPFIIGGFAVVLAAMFLATVFIADKALKEGMPVARVEEARPAWLVAGLHDKWMRER